MDLFEGIRNIFIIGTLILGQAISSVLPLNQSQPEPTSEPTPTPKIIEQKANPSPSLLPTALPSPENKNPSTNTTNFPSESAQTNIQSTDQNDQITISEGFSYLGQTVDFWVSFPENGGDISGGFSGSCSGSINGKYEGGEGGMISGSAKGRCGGGIFSLNLTAFYKGRVYLSRREISIEWDLLEPIKNTGSTTLNFD